jgi:hypothetical protein
VTVAEIKAAVRERDGNRCVDCGATKPDPPPPLPSWQKHQKIVLDVHRVIPQSEYTVDGCVTLCPRCHRLRHVGIIGPSRKPPGSRVNRSRRVSPEEIQELLDLNSWPRTKLAAEMKMTEASVYGWLKGVRVPSGPVSVLIRLWLEEARKKATVA